MGIPRALTVSSDEMKGFTQTGQLLDVSQMLTVCSMDPRNWSGHSLSHLYTPLSHLSRCLFCLINYYTTRQEEA